MANIRNLIYNGITVEQPVHNGVNLTKWIHNGVVVWENGDEPLPETFIISDVSSSMYPSTNNLRYIAYWEDTDTIYFNDEAREICYAMEMEDWDNRRFVWQTDEDEYIINGWFWMFVTDTPTLLQPWAHLTKLPYTYYYTYTITSSLKNEFYFNHNCPYIKYAIGVNYTTNKVIKIDKETFGYEELNKTDFDSFCESIVNAQYGLSDTPLLCLFIGYNAHYGQEIIIVSIHTFQTGYAIKGYAVYDMNYDLIEEVYFGSNQTISRATFVFFGDFFLGASSSNIVKCDIGSSNLEVIKTVSGYSLVGFENVMSNIDYDGKYAMFIGRSRNNYKMFIVDHSCNVSESNVFSVVGHTFTPICVIHNYIFTNQDGIKKITFS